MNKLFVIMGVSGCGKTTVGKLLATKMELPFLDADAFHPQENIQKMAQGIALTDVDRQPWLEQLNTTLKTHATTGVVLACSALKESYRDLLSKGITNLQWIYLKGDFKLIQQRMQQRQQHFMDVNLLQSQFDTLEAPNYGWHLSITNSPEEIVNQIQKSMTKASFGIIGLGVMGKSIAINALNHGISVAVYNRETEFEVNVAQKFVETQAGKKVQGFSVLEDFVNALETPRNILLMVNAGTAVDHVVENLLPFLSEEDIILDGGNSHYQDTNRRIASLKEKNIHFLGVGISGGEEGALKGPSLMPGGDLQSYQQVASVLETIAAKDKNGKPCCEYIGPNGAGHFVKMVHNGIEYGDMQLLAELYEILGKSKSYEEIANIFNEWNQTELSSYLLDITAQILQTKEGAHYVLDTILDKAGNKGTGSWSSKAALELGIPTTVKTAAVYARYLSSFKEKRQQLAAPTKKTIVGDLDVEVLKEAYSFSRILNLHQGFELLREASKAYQWQLNLATICRIWSNGCIIKSELLHESSKVLQQHASLIDDENIIQKLRTQETAVTKVLQYALENRLNVPCISAAYSYWLHMTTERTAANMIQAQRDFFGAHTFQKINDPTGQKFHYNWKAL
jgi:6-phosphogluconate dehydrogenase